MAAMGDVATGIEAAREAVSRHAWTEALDHYAAADATTVLEPADLEAVAEASWWVGKMRDCIAARERAYAAFLDAGDVRGAARMALRLADHHSDLAEQSVSSAWLQRAAKLLEGQPESAEHAMQALYTARGAGDAATALECASRAVEIATRHGDKDLLGLALALNGGLLVGTGDVDRGMQMLEEATVAAVSGDLGPFATGIIYCMMISTTSELADWQRAGQWTEAAKRWCDRQAISGFPGVCRVHRAEIMRLRGSLSEAEEEASVATVELGAFNLWFAALAFKELGEIRLRMGDFDAAEDAFRQAHEMGVVPQPGLAHLQILRGKHQAAFTGLKRALSDAVSPLDRAKLLPTQVEAALLLADLDTARTAAAELEKIAASFTSHAMQASAEAAMAALAHAEGDLGRAEAAATRARRLYKETDLLYEFGRATMLLGQIYQAEGDVDGAEYEYRTALSTFEKIGAVPAINRARDLIAALAAPSPEAVGRRVAKTFLFSDIVKSTNLLDAIGDDAWTDLLAWHDDTLRKSFVAHGGEEVVHTGDGFFIAFETADDAVACATAIQRALAEHRRAHGFAPQVRIGLHATEAAEVKGNYHGKGVHEAARIGALAEGGEILASASTLECLGAPVKTRDERAVTLKGVAEPVTVLSIAWRET